ncbi:CHASE domain-containing protein [Actinoplanes sp. NPDC049802]|uniref:sensor histidine kinase n=1 Tax=Actinoplanes sp. NPDC049802 TaxID=3154742 RepID=UPI0033EB94E1
MTVSLALTASATLWSAATVADSEATELRNRAATAQQLINGRLGTYTEILYGLRALRGASEELRRREFHQYIASLRVLDRYPGVQVIGFAPLVREKPAAFEASVRADAAASGLPYPRFAIHPPGVRLQYAPISFIEPQTGNLPAFGFDFLSEPSRRQALERTRDTGQPAATAPVTLVQETASQTGFLIMLATYRPGLPLGTLTQRRAAFLGVEYAAFRMGDLLAGVLGQNASRHALEIYDRGPAGDPEPAPLSEATRTYDTDERADAVSANGGNRTEAFPVIVGGRRWDVHYRAAEALVSPQERAAPWTIAGLGLLLSLLLTWLFWITSTARERAVALAGQMTVQLRESERRLARSNRELERFAYVASHDLQEPLRTVSSFVGLLEQRYGDRLDERAHRYIEFAVDGTRRMSGMISDLLTYSRVGRGDSGPVPTDLAAAWDEAVANLRGAIEEAGAQVTRGDLPTAQATPLHAVQLFQNLISNALKYRGPQAPEIVAGAVPAEGGQEWHITVSDNGIGIDPRHHDRIFVVFQRLHTADEYPGTGMGLAICKKIVESYGGRIWVESQAGDGSRFHLTFPATAAPATRPGRELAGVR